MMSKQKKFLSMVIVFTFIFSFTVSMNSPVVLADTVFSDDFESNAIDSQPGGGWTRSSGTWLVKQDTSKALSQTVGTYGVIYNGSGSWSNYTYTARIKCTNTANSLGLAGRFQSSSNYYYLKLNNSSIALQKNVGGTWTNLENVNFTRSSTNYHTVKMEFNGDSIKGYVDGVLMVSATDSTFQTGSIGLVAGADSYFDDVEVYDLLPTVTTVPSSYPGMRDANGNVVPTHVPNAKTGTTRTVSADTADNANDDRPAIETALNAAVTGDEVYLPNGVYNLNTPWSSNSSVNIALKSGVNIRGQSQSGVILKTNFDVGTDDALYRAVINGTAVSNITLSNLTITSTFNRQYSNNTSVQNPDRGGPRYGIHLSYSGGNYSNNVTIDRVTVEKFAGYGGIMLSHTNNVVVKNCTAKNATEVSTGGYGISVGGTNSYYNVVDNCRLIGADLGYLRHGILLEASHNNVVKNNYLKDVLIDAIDLHGEGENEIEITNNTVVGTVNEAAICAGNPGATHDASGPSNWIHNNYIYNCKYGVRSLFGSPNTIIQNNEITGSTSISGGAGIVLGSSPDAVVQGNRVLGNTSSSYYGIHLKYDTGSVWSDGTIHNPGVPTNVTLTDNVVNNNTMGIRIEAGTFAAESNNTASGNASRNYFKVINPSFEFDSGTTIQSPTGWSESGTVAASFANNTAAYSGTYELRIWNSTAFNVTTSQVVSVPNGTYTLKARVRNISSGQNSAVMFASGFGGTTKTVDIKAVSSSWTQYTISSINVTNGTCTIGFTVDSPGGKTLEIDSVEFYK